MSVRAYRVNKKELAEKCSFDCWHDADLLDFFLYSEFCGGLNEEGKGSMEVPVPALEKVLAEYPWKAGEDYRRDAIQADIAWAREYDRETVEYDCF